jgi:hypothetical protein
MRFGLLPTLFASLFLAACSAPSGTKSSTVSQPARAPQAYVRVLSGSNTVQLQIAARKFVSSHRKRPCIWLTGVSHIGEPKYFAALQRHLDEQTVVLFEGINDSRAAMTPSDSETKREAEPVQSGGAREKLSSLQVSMAETLGLAFQLEAIDYSRSNFFNSDLSMQQLREIIAQTGAGESFESLLKMMEGGSWLDAVLQVVFRFLSTSPKLQGLSKLALMETIGEIQGDPAQMRGLPPQIKELLDVLIARRNEKVVADLKLQIPRMAPGKSIAVFYGTGHMPDLEARLRELNYRPAEQLWFTAFSVDKAATGISETEYQFVRSFIQREFQEAQEKDKP